MPELFQKPKPTTSSQQPETSDQILNPWENDPILDPAHELPEPEIRPDNQTTRQPATREDDDEDEEMIKTFFNWTAPSRPFRKKDKSYFQTIAIIIALLILISLLAGEFILVAVLLAFSFVAYVMGLTPPDDINYKITTQGVTIGGHFYFWDYLDSFWATRKDDQNLIQILTDLNFPAQITLVLGDQDTEKIKRVLAKYLPYHEIEPQTLIDKWSHTLQSWFPLEKQSV